MRYEEIKNIIQQYADKSMKNYSESLANEGKEASCTRFWDGFSQCANLLLLEVLDKKPKFELSQEQKEEIFNKVLNMAEPEFIDDSDLPKLYSEMNLKEFSEEWDGSMYLSDAIVAGAKWQKEQMIRQLEDIVYRRYSPDGDSNQRNKDLIKLIQSWKCQDGV